MTTPERSPCGTMCVFGSILVEEAELFQSRDDLLARGEAVDAVSNSSASSAAPSGKPRR